MYKYWFLETAIKGLLLINFIAFKRGINQYSIKLFPFANLAIKIKYLPATFYFESFGQKIQRFLFFLPYLYICTYKVYCFNEAGSPKPKPAESPMPLQPRPELSQPEEENQSQPVPVVQQNPPTIAVEDVPVVRTPKRQSYLPIIPSPLLQDCTPQPRFTRSLLKHTPLNATEDKIETPRPRRQSLRLI